MLQTELVLLCCPVTSSREAAAEVRADARLRAVRRRGQA